MKAHVRVLYCREQNEKCTSIVSIGTVFALVHRVQTPAVVDTEGGSQRHLHWDLFEDNEHLFYSETIRWTLSQVDGLYRLCALKATGAEPPELPTVSVAVGPHGEPLLHAPPLNDELVAPAEESTRKGGKQTAPDAKKSGVQRVLSGADLTLAFHIPSHRMPCALCSRDGLRRERGRVAGVESNESVQRRRRLDGEGERDAAATAGAAHDNGAHVAAVGARVRAQQGTRAGARASHAHAYTIFSVRLGACRRAAAGRAHRASACRSTTRTASTASSSSSWCAPLATRHLPLATRSRSRSRSQGCWRKITVDDSIPFDADDRPLLPFIAKRPHELWPALLVKGLLKIAALEYPIRFNRDCCE